MAEFGRETVIAHNDPSPARERVLRVFEQKHAPINIQIALPSLEAIKRAVEMRMGVALLPKRCALDRDRARPARRGTDAAASSRTTAAARVPAGRRACHTPPRRSSRPRGNIIPNTRRERLRRLTIRRRREVARRSLAPASKSSSRRPVASHSAARERIARARGHRGGDDEIAGIALCQRDQIGGELGRGIRFGTRQQTLDVGRRHGEARQSELRRVAEEDFRITLADDRPDAPALERLRRMLARRPAAEVAVDDQDRRALVAQGCRTDAPPPARSSSNTCRSRPSNDTATRKRAGMMRSVSMSWPRSGSARPVTC